MSAYFDLESGLIVRTEEITVHEVSAGGLGEAILKAGDVVKSITIGEDINVQCHDGFISQKTTNHCRKTNQSSLFIGVRAIERSLVIARKYKEERSNEWRTILPKCQLTSR